jgi:hypothetical protein
MNGLEKIIMKFRALPLLLLGFLSLRLFAQEATEEASQGWPIVERCVGEPTTPPADWSFEGTILATGWAGIHGINAGWETARVLAFQDSHNDNFISESISPNGLWHIKLYGSTAAGNLTDGNPSTIANQIIVTDMLTMSESYSISLTSANIWWRAREVHDYGSVRVFWWNETHVALLNKLINLTTGEIEDLPINLYHNNDSSLAPDHSREVAGTIPFRGTSFLLRFENGVGVRDNALSQYLGFIWEIDWSSDSTFFAGVGVQSIRDENETLYLFSRDGELIANVYHQNDVFQMFPDISYNNNYLIFLADNHKLMIADIPNAIVYDTCNQILYGPQAWSALDEQFAFLPIGEGQRPVLVFDLNDWQIYETGFYHDGAVIGWRAD